MIYLQYIYQQSKLPAPAYIVLEVSDTLLLQRETVDEFSHAFKDARVESLPIANSPADFIVLAFRDSQMNTYKKIVWGAGAYAKAKYGIGFFCVNQRNFVIVPSAHFWIWAVRELLVSSCVLFLSFPFKISSRLPSVRKKVI